MGGGLPLQGNIADFTYRICGDSHRTAVLGVHPGASTVRLTSPDISSRHTHTGGRYIVLSGCG